MNTHRKIEWSIFMLGVAGFLFSGYLSSVKFFTETCAFNESCPYFFSIPACYVGFVLFTTIAVMGGMHVFHCVSGKRANDIILAVSGLGIVFAGYYTVIELPALFSEGLTAYMLGLPTCALGLIFFVLVGGLALRLKRDF